MSDNASLTVVVYHYIRDFRQTRFPKIKGLPIDTFRTQVAELGEKYRFTTLDVAMRVLAGDPDITGDYCLLTFDDGLKEHYTDVLPILVEHGASGCFFPPTACLQGEVAAVQKLHFLMAAVEFAELQQVFNEAVEEILNSQPKPAAPQEIARCYPWDTPEVGAFKYQVNFVLPAVVRDRVVDALFIKYLGDESVFAKELYLTWDELREMQAQGMTIGGHSHRHPSLPSLTAGEQMADLWCCTALLRERLRAQEQWPFSYPYGRYDHSTLEILRELHYDCAFTVESGTNLSGQHRFRIRRFDPLHLLSA